ncbi:MULTISPECIES: PepSY domain-containing protein [unclassified Acidovorax]|uniref:PepSY domain-containing protein n=1 Tax=unclassified Acidovorax TaxID=2684926 RepID=UPI001C489B17|nr:MULTISPECIES: PepSY domain-containing protein [unclassified Acidovorax]MBV7427894.1 PepSY domain-containing protein [Acidovorax sp. sif0732]MBV7449151.1 PepSY domain-containing protein [Acidovorax sp. sif0715]
MTDISLRTIVRAAACAAVALACAQAPAAEQDVARRGVQSGQLKPLNSIIADMSRQYGGRVIDVETKHGRKGELRYEIKIIDARGTKHEVLVDAATGSVVAQERDWPTQPVSLAQMARYIQQLEQRYGSRVVNAEFERDAQGKAVYEVKFSDRPAGEMKLLVDVNTGEVLTPPQTAGTPAAPKSMAVMLESLRPRFSGLVLEVELETDHRRRPYYSVELQQPNGFKLELEVDAVSLEVTRQKVDD